MHDVELDHSRSNSLITGEAPCALCPFRSRVAAPQNRSAHVKVERDRERERERQSSAMEYKQQQPCSPPAAHVQPRLIVHGGAGNVRPSTLPIERRKAFRASLLRIVGFLPFLTSRPSRCLFSPETRSTRANHSPVAYLDNAGGGVHADAPSRERPRRDGSADRPRDGHVRRAPLRRRPPVQLRPRRRVHPRRHQRAGGQRHGVARPRQARGRRHRPSSRAQSHTAGPRHARARGSGPAGWQGGQAERRGPGTRR
ncbi:hypothetical protein VTK73DRAFT_1299 [Phialemonium thermophilum]|uniref:Uncharacterized protein n=1 Tax=Phialemonium thermophilum TaxID=223376 RepID=A0ABR3VTP7_9PEZI